jgi:hypothetical protein
LDAGILTLQIPRCDFRILGFFTATAFGQLQLLAAECVIPADGVRLQVFLLAVFTFGGTGAQNQEEIPMVPPDAIVAAHREPEKQEPKEILSLPAGGANVGGIAESTFHWALVLWLGKRNE